MHLMLWGGVVAGVFLLLGRYLVHLPFIGYIFERFTRLDQLLTVDSWQTEVGLQPAMVVLLLLLFVMIGLLYRKRKYEENSNLYVFINLNLLFSLMMVVCDMLGMYYMAAKLLSTLLVTNYNFISRKKFFE